MPSIDDYDIGQLLGKGGFACVYRARHRISGENVALKVIAKSIAVAVVAGGHDANSISRVKNEISIHSQLRHSNIVRFMGCFEDDHNVYMILELCNYGNMFQFLRRNGPLSESIAVIVIQQLILALEYIHEHGVVHRDLKLSNILLARPDIDISSSNDKSFIKICDFGLAIKKEHPDEEHYTLCGTPNYIAPEIASQHAHGYPADLWSIGCLFYSLVVGTPPFEKEKGREGEDSAHGNVKDTLQRILSGEYNEPVDKLSPTGVLFLRSLLHLNPSKRANIKQLLAHPLLSPPHLPPHPPTADSASSFHLKKGVGGNGVSAEGPRSNGAADRIAVHYNNLTSAVVGGNGSYSRRSDVGVMPASIRVVHTGGMKDHVVVLPRKTSSDDIYFDCNANNNSSATTALMSITTPQLLSSSDSNATANSTTDQGYSGRSRSAEDVRPIPSAEPVILHKPRAVVSKRSSTSGRPIMMTQASKGSSYLKDGSSATHTIDSSHSVNKQDTNVCSGGPLFRSSSANISSSSSRHHSTPASSSSSAHHNTSASSSSTHHNTSAASSSSSSRHHIVQVDARDSLVSPPYHAVSDSVHYQRSHHHHHQMSCSSNHDKAVLLPVTITQTSSIQSDRSHSSASWYDAIVDMRSSSHSIINNNSSHNVSSGGGGGIAPAGLNINTGDSSTRGYSPRSSADKGSSTWMNQYAHEKFIRDPAAAAVVAIRSSSSRPSEMPMGIAAAATAGGGEPSHRHHNHHHHQQQQHYHQQQQQHYHQQQKMDEGRRKDDNDTTSTAADRAVSDYHDVIQSATALRPLVLVTKREDVLLITVERTVLFYTKVKIRTSSNSSSSSSNSSSNSNSSSSHGHCSRIVRLIIRPSQRYTVLFGAVVDDATSQEVRIIARRVQAKDGHHHHQQQVPTHTQSTERLVEATTSNTNTTTTSFTFHDEFSEQQLLVFANSPSLRSFRIGSGAPPQGTASDATAADGRTGRLPSVIAQLLRKIVEALRNIKCQVPKRIFYFSTPSFRVSTYLPPHVSSSSSSPAATDSNRGFTDARGASVQRSLQEEAPVVDCKCMLMSNDPLPDFYIQWVDGVKLRYVLQTGRVRIDGTSHSQLLYWEGLLHLSSINTPIRPGHQEVFPTIAAQFIPYLQVAQSAFRRCLSEQDDRDHAPLRPTSSFSSSSSSSSSSQTAARPKILVL